MKTLFLAVVGLIILLSSYNSKAQNSNDEIKQIIIEKYQKMRVALKNGDPNYVLNMHTTDAILFLQNGKEVVGITELKPFYDKVATSGIDINSTPTTVELLSENIVFEVGTFIGTTKTGTQNSAKYVNIWKKIDGDWKLFKAIDQAKL
jgi:ketosteroid isomerase-like protein